METLGRRNGKRVGKSGYLKVKGVRQSAAFHRQLLSALRERDTNRVEQLLTEVFDNLEKEFIQVLQKVPWVDSSTDKVEKSLQ